MYIRNVFCKSDYKGMVTRFLRGGDWLQLSERTKSQFCKLKMSLSIKLPQLCHKTDNKIQVVLRFVGRKLAICLKKKTNRYLYTVMCDWS